MYLFKNDQYCFIIIFIHKHNIYENNSSQINKMKESKKYVLIFISKRSIRKVLYYHDCVIYFA